MNNDLFSLKKELIKTEGYKIINKINLFSASLCVFKVNYNELITYLDSQIEKPNEDEWGRFDMNEPMINVMRLFHNYIASVYTLIETTRKFYKDECVPSSKVTDYEKQVKERFASSPVACIVKDLRKLFQHCSIPPISFAIRESEKGLSNARFYWGAEELLLSYRKWSSRAKQYIYNSPNGEINVKTISQDYFNLTQSFYNWFIKELLKDYQDIIKEYEMLRDRIISIEIEEEIPRFLDVNNLSYSPLNMINLSLLILPKEQQNKVKNLICIQQVDLLLQSFTDQKRIDTNTQRILHDKYLKYINGIQDNAHNCQRGRDKDA